MIGMIVAVNINSAAGMKVVSVEQHNVTGAGLLQRRFHRASTPVDGAEGHARSEFTFPA